VVESSGVEATGLPYLALSGHSLGLGRVQCFFEPQARPAVARIQKGEVVTVVGTVSGKGAVNVIVDDCRLQ
jgi:hypothetical protein